MYIFTMWSVLLLLPQPVTLNFDLDPDLDIFKVIKQSPPSNCERAVTYRGQRSFHLKAIACAYAQTPSSALQGLIKWSVTNTRRQLPVRYSTTFHDHSPLPVSPRTIADVSVLAVLDIHAPAWPRPHRKCITIGQLNPLWLIRHHTYMPQTAHQ